MSLDEKTNRSTESNNSLHPTIFIEIFFFSCRFRSCGHKVVKNLLFSPLSANFTKWSNTLKEFVKLPTNCLSVFHHFVELALKISHWYYIISLCFWAYACHNYFVKKNSAFFEHIEETKGKVSSNFSFERKAKMLPEENPRTLPDLRWSYFTVPNGYLCCLKSHLMYSWAPESLISVKLVSILLKVLSWNAFIKWNTGTTLGVMIL